MAKLICKITIGLCLTICLISAHGATQRTKEQQQFLESLELSASEKLWLDSIKKVRVHPDTWPPFNYWDVKTGTNQGICVEYLRWVENKTGINFEYPAMWMPLREVLPALKNKTLDLSPSLQKTRERETYLAYSKLQYQESFSIFSLLIIDQSAVDILSHPVSVSCEEGSTTYNYLKRNFPNINLIPAATEEDGLRMVANHKCDYHAGAASVCQYLIKNYYGLENIKAAAQLKYSGQGIYMTARKDWPELVSIIDKALEKMPTSKKQAIVDNYLNTFDWNKYKDHLFWVLTSLVLLFAFAIILLLSSLRKQRAQKELIRKNELKLQRATDTAKLYFLEYIPYRHEILLNTNAAKALTGNSATTYLSLKSCLKLVYKDDRELITMSLRHRNYSDSFRVRILRPSGQFIFLNCFVNRDRSNNKHSILISCLDITREVLYNKQLISTQRLAHIGYYRLDQNSKRFLLTEETCRILGLPLKHNDYKLRELLKLISPKIRMRQLDKIRSAIQSRQYEYKTTLPIINSVGQRKYIQLISRCIYNDKGNIVLQEGYLQDITDSKKAELALKQAKNQAVMANKSKSTFLARMSHEIRTPLNVIVGMLNLALKTKLTDKQHNYIQKSNSSSQLLLSLINDILDFSKIEAGKVTLQHSNFNLKKCCDDIEKLLLMKATEKNLQLRFMIDNSLPALLYGDEIRLKQVLINLINNAIKFTENGNIVVKILPGKNESAMQITVSDTGIGIPKQKLSLLFESFVQLNDSILSHQEGTGLGLTICKHIVDLWGGEIWVKSTVGKGTTFGFTMPLIPGSQEPSVAENNVSFKRLKNSPRILLAEDNQLNQEIASEILAEFHIKTTIASDGEEAIKTALSQPFDLVLMDLNMPEKDGIAATKEIRTKIPKEKLPIIAVTAYALPELKLECIKSGMNDYLSKPFTESEILQVLHKWLPEYFNKTITANNQTKENHSLRFNKSRALGFLGNNEDRFIKYLNLFNDSVPERYVKLKDLDHGHHKELAKMAHTLKSEAGYLGLDELEVLCKKVQHETTPENFEEMQSTLLNELNNAQKEIEKYLA